MSFPGAGDAFCLRSGLIKGEKASGLFPLASWQLLQKSLLHPCRGGDGGKLTSCQGGAIPNCAATNRNRPELWPQPLGVRLHIPPPPSGARRALSRERAP